MPDDTRPGAWRTARDIGLFTAAVVLSLTAAAVVIVTLGRPPADAHTNGDTPTAALEGSAVTGRSSDGGFRVWEHNDDGSPVRWDPCSPIDIVLADELAPANWRRDLDTALETLRAATGLELRVTGPTDETPRRGRSPYQPARYGERWAPVLIAWARPGGELALRDVDRGLGIPVAVGTDGDRVYVSGQVVLNADRLDLEVGGRDRATSWAATVLHEMSHVLGLDHVDDDSQLMSTYPGDGPVELGSGDLAGLRHVGADFEGPDEPSERGKGCLEVPEPQAVEVN